jgi:transposase
MSNSVCARDIPAYAGVDVGSRELVLALRIGEGAKDCGSFTNDKQGVNELAKQLKALNRPVFACMEATGTYFLRPAMKLASVKGISVMVSNPRNIKDYARATNHRSKTDKVDARVIALFAQRERFVEWHPPSENMMSLRSISRRIDERVSEKAAEKCRRHALRAAGEWSRCVEKDILACIKGHEEAVERLRNEAREIIKADDELRFKFRLLLSVKGIGEASAIRILAELCVMPACMSARQWTSYAGLDPVHNESGTSIKKPSRISRSGNARLRSALFFAAMVASKHEPHVRAFYEKLLQKGKMKLQAIVAVMRKLLHAIWGMFKNSTTFDSSILFPYYTMNP